MSTSRNNAFTLVEMMLGLFIITLLLGAVEGALVMSAKSIPDGRSGTSATMIGSRAMDMMAQDFFYANGGTCTSATDITITVPSRSGGSGNDTIRYYWDTSSSTTPLMRQVNGGTAVKIADNVKEFSLVYDRKQVQQATTYSQTSEQLLNSSGSGLLQGDQTINSSNYAGEYFKPSLPTGAASWNVTKVIIRARADGATTGQTSVQIRTASNGLPTSTTLDSAVLNESSLQSQSGGLLGTGLLGSDGYTNQTLTFTKATGLSTTDGACIVISSVGGDTSCDVQYQTLSLANGNDQMITSSNGSSWSKPLAQLIYSVYGTANIPNPTSYTYYLTNVRANLLVGSDTHARLNSNMRVINEPQVN